MNFTISLSDNEITTLQLSVKQRLNTIRCGLDCINDTDELLLKLLNTILNSGYVQLVDGIIVKI
jgi:hypothetical protein